MNVSLSGIIILAGYDDRQLSQMAVRQRFVVMCACAQYDNIQLVFYSDRYQRTVVMHTTDNIASSYLPTWPQHIGRIKNELFFF